MKFVVDRKRFEKVLGFVKNIRDEVVFVVDAEEKKLKVETINYARSALAIVKVDLADVDESFSFAVDASKIHDVVKVMSGILTVTKREGEIEISSENVVYRITEYVGEYVKVPESVKFEATAEARLFGSDLKILIDLTKKIEVVTFCEGYALAEGDTEKIKCVFAEYKGSAKSSYDVMLLRDLKPIIDSGSDILIMYGNDMPARILITGDGYEIEYIVAPRVMAVD